MVSHTTSKNINGTLTQQFSEVQKFLHACIETPGGNVCCGLKTFWVLVRACMHEVCRVSFKKKGDGEG